MQQGTRLTKNITFSSYLSKQKTLQNPNKTHPPIKTVQGKRFLLFLQRFDPHYFQLVYDLLLKRSSYLHESEAM